AIKRLYRWGRKSGYIKTNPLADVEKPEAKARETDLTLTSETIEAIRAAHHPEDPFVDYLDVLRYTGMRPSEIEALQANQIDFEAREAHIVGKRRKRTVILGDQVIDILRRLAAKHPEGPLLRNVRGNPWTRHSVACRFGDLRPKLGLGAEVTAEAYRHAF